MPNYNPKPNAIRPKTPQISASLINQLIEMIPSVIVGSDTIDVQQVGDRIVIQSLIQQRQPRPDVNTFVVLQELNDVIVCADIDLIPNYDPAAAALAKIIVFVAKPYYLQATPFENQTVQINNQYPQKINTAGLGLRTCGGAFQQITPGYFPGSIIQAMKCKTGYWIQTAKNSLPTWTRGFTSYGVAVIYDIKTWICINVNGTTNYPQEGADWQLIDDRYILDWTDFFWPSSSLVRYNNKVWFENNPDGSNNTPGVGTDWKDFTDILPKPGDIISVDWTDLNSEGRHWQNFGPVVYLQTGELLNDAFEGRYDDLYDIDAALWWDEIGTNPLEINITKSGKKCWVVDTKKNLQLDPNSRWISVFRNFGAVGPWFVNTIINNDGDVNNGGWVQIITDIFSIKNYPTTVVTSTTLINGQLTINEPPDFPAILDVIITDSGSSITAGDISFNNGAEVISIVGGTFTYTTTLVYNENINILVENLVGGSSTTIEIIIHEYATGVLRNYGGNIWVVNTPDDGPPVAPNWTNLGAALNEVVTIYLNDTYAVGDYGKQQLPIFAIQGSLTGQLVNSPTTLCGLLAKEQTTSLTITTDDGVQGCLVVPICAWTPGPCDGTPIIPVQSGGLCSGVNPTNPIIYVHLTWPSGIAYINAPTCVPLQYKSTTQDSLLISDIDQNKDYWGATFSWIGGDSIARGAGFAILAYCDNDPSNPLASPLGYYTGFQDGYTFPGDPTGTFSTFGRGGYYTPVDPKVFYIADPTASINTPGPPAGQITLGFALIINTTPCDGSDPAQVVKITNPIVPITSLFVPVTIDDTPTLTVELANVSVTKLQGTFIHADIPGTSTLILEFSNNQYWMTFTNSTDSNTFITTPITIFDMPSFFPSPIEFSPLTDVNVIVGGSLNYLPASASHSTVSVSSASVATGATVDVTVQLLDANDKPIANKLITLSVTGSGTGNGSTQLTNANGKAIFTGLTDSTIETVTYSAVDTTDSVSITDTATVSYSGSTTITSSGTTNAALIGFTVASASGLSSLMPVTMHLIRTSDSAAFTVDGTIGGIAGLNININVTAINSPGNPAGGENYDANGTLIF